VVVTGGVAGLQGRSPKRHYWRRPLVLVVVATLRTPLLTRPETQSLVGVHHYRPPFTY
jgi:hypothetical protein